MSLSRVRTWASGTWARTKASSIGSRMDSTASEWRTAKSEFTDAGQVRKPPMTQASPRRVASTSASTPSQGFSIISPTSARR